VELAESKQKILDSDRWVFRRVGSGTLPCACSYDRNAYHCDYVSAIPFYALLFLVSGKCMNLASCGLQILGHA